MNRQNEPKKMNRIINGLSTYVRSTMLTEISIPVSVSTIGSGAFSLISTLHSISYYNCPSCLSLMDASTFTSSSKTNDDDVIQCNLNHIDLSTGQFTG